MACPRCAGIARPAALAVEHEAGDAFAGGVGVEGERGLAAAADFAVVHLGECLAAVARFPDAQAVDDHVDIAGSGVDRDAGGFAGEAEFLSLVVELLDDRVGQVDPRRRVDRRFGRRIGGAGEGCGEESGEESGGSSESGHGRPRVWFGAGTSGDVAGIK